jgi:hypothetical protein
MYNYLFSLTFKNKVLQAIASASKQITIKDIDKKHKTFPKYSMPEYILLGLVKRFMKMKKVKTVENDVDLRPSARAEDHIPIPAPQFQKEESKVEKQ